MDDLIDNAPGVIDTYYYNDPNKFYYYDNHRMLQSIKLKPFDNDAQNATYRQALLEFFRIPMGGKKLMGGRIFRPRTLTPYLELLLDDGYFQTPENPPNLDTIETNNQIWMFWNNDYYVYVGFDRNEILDILYQLEEDEGVDGNGRKLRGGAETDSGYSMSEMSEEEDEGEELSDIEEENENEALELRITSLMRHNERQLQEEEELDDEEAEDIIIAELQQAGLNFYSNDRNELLLVRHWLFHNLNGEHQAEALAEEFDDGEDIWGGGFFSDLKDKVKHIFGKSSKYNNISTKTLTEYGGMKIKELVATREKIQQALKLAMNLVSSGNFGTATQKLGYDDLFHIRLFARMEDGKLLLIEKNEVIYIKPTDKIKGEPLPIKYKEGSLTLQQLMDAGQKQLGEGFFLYDAFTNNCASFVVGILKGNNLWSADDTKFLAQDVSSLKAQLPKTSAVSNFVTSLGAIVSRIQGKGGKNRKGKYSSMEDAV
jgi:hypothetical protein